MEVVVIILRIVHIVFGVFWVGGVMLMSAFLVPTIIASGPEGGRFMGRLTQRGLLPSLLGSAALSSLAGIMLYLYDSQGLRMEWVMTPTGLTFGIGGICAIIALI